MRKKKNKLLTEIKITCKVVSVIEFEQISCFELLLQGEIFILETGELNVSYFSFGIKI